MPAGVPFNRESLAQLCRRHHIRRLSFFGSVLREDFSENSDVDVLIEFDSGRSVRFFQLHRIERELSALFGGRRVDLGDPAQLKPRLRDQVLAEAEIQYVTSEE